MTDRHTVDSINSDQLDQLYDELARAEETVTRVTGLYEQWVKAGAPPLGTSMSRWWDRRLVELHDAIRTPTEQPVRTIPNNPSALRDQIAAVLYERERPPRDPHWADAYAMDREVFEAMADTVLTALRPQLAALAEYESAITWHTDCLNCARVMNSAYAETMRAETVEAAVREFLDVLLPVHAGGEIIGYEPPLPIQAAAVDRWRAVLDEEQLESGAWTPPPPGSTAEQLPETLLALIRDRLPDYTSTACQTADTVACAACYPGSGVPRPQYDEIREHAERLHERCRLNHKFTGQLCACGCHPEEQQL